MSKELTEKKDVKVTIEDDKQKAFITIKNNGDDTHTIEFTFDPELDLKSKEESLVLNIASRFMDFLSGV